MTFTNELINYFIYDYPSNYDINNLPHDNTLKAAIKYCIINNCSGVTYQDNIYQVRNGNYLYHFENTKNIDLRTWVYI